MHWTGTLILLGFVTVCAALILLSLHLTRAGRILHERIPDRPHRRLFLASVSFFVTFLGVRLLVAAITHHIGPFGWVMVHGHHIHHLVWGIAAAADCGLCGDGGGRYGIIPGFDFGQPADRDWIRYRSGAHAG